MSASKEERIATITYQGVKFESEYYKWVTANHEDPFATVTPSAFVEIKNNGTALTSSQSPEPTFIPLLSPVSMSIQALTSTPKNYVTPNSTIYTSVRMTPLLIVISSGPNQKLYSELFEAFGKQTGNNFNITVKELNTTSAERTELRKEIFNEAMILSLKQTETEILILFDFIEIIGTGKSMGGSPGVVSYSYNKRNGWTKV